MPEFTHVSFAYKLAILPLLLGEADYLAEKLKLEEPRPITMACVRDKYIVPPAMGFGGVISTTNFTYSFDKNGKLMSLGRIDSEGMVIPSVLQHGALAKVKSVIDSKQAYQMATQWLGSISFDVASFEKVSVVRVEQLDSKVFGLLPLFDLHWTSTNSCGEIEMSIDGSTKQLSRLYIPPEAGAYLHRPAMSLPNADMLNAIPDPPKKKLEQREQPKIAP